MRDNYTDFDAAMRLDAADRCPIILAGFAAFLDLYATQPLLPLLARTFHASHVRRQPDGHRADDRGGARGARSSGVSPISSACAASSSGPRSLLAVATALAATSHDAARS